MMLPEKVIDRLFKRLAASYGRSWDGMWESTPIEDVKTAWAHELSGFTPHLDDVAWALDNLPEKPPNVIEFRNLCRKAPRPTPPMLPSPPAQPDRVAAEMENLRMSVSSGKQDPKDWARRIIARHEAGDRIIPISLRFARESLGLIKT